MIAQERTLAASKATTAALDTKVEGALPHQNVQYALALVGTNLSLTPVYINFALNVYLHGVR